MSNLNWTIIHESDDEDGNPTCWSTEINHPVYGKYVWIDGCGNRFTVSVNTNGFKEIYKCKSFVGAKRWVNRNLI